MLNLKNSRVARVLFIIVALGGLLIFSTEDQFLSKQLYKLSFLKPKEPVDRKYLDGLLSIGISIGGTNIRMGLVSAKGHFIVQPEEFAWRKKLKVAATSEDIVDMIMAGLENLLNNVDDINKIVKIGIAFAGPVDTINGIVGTPFPAPNLPFTNYKLVKVIEQRYQELINSKYCHCKHMPIKICLYNDSHASALGELSQTQDGMSEGMIFILGTGTNGAVVSGGKLFTDNGALLELGFNLVKLGGENGDWEFTGKKTKGNKPVRHPEELYNIDLFSGEGIVEQFLRYEGAIKVISKYVLLPEGVATVRELFEVVTNNRKEQAKIKALVINAVLTGITIAVGENDPVANTFVNRIGDEFGRSLAALIKYYYYKPWVEHIILVGSISEKFCKTERDDIFIDAIRNGVRNQLLGDRKYKGSNKRTEMIARGITRSKMNWMREILAAKISNEDVR